MSRPDKYRLLKMESKSLREGFAAAYSMSDHAQYILRNVQSIDRCKKSIAEQNASKIPNSKIIARCNDIIANCTSAFKSTLIKMGADAECVKKATKFLESNDIENIQCIILKLLTRSNPELYAKKYKMLEQKIAQRG